MFCCEKCSYTTDNPLAFGGHKGSHTRYGLTLGEMRKRALSRPEIDKTTECVPCGQKFKDGRGLLIHTRRRHETSFEELKTDGTRKFRLVQERGHRCEVCGIAEWMGQKAPIELDHIDGNSENSSKDNLRLVCPNCHAQTSTYRGKNVGKNGRTRRVEKYEKYGTYR